MQFIMPIIDRYPHIKKVLKSVYYFLQGLPPISYSEITEDLILKCVCKPNPTILEIGSNDGGHTLWFDKIFDSPTIHCFEPDLRAIERFKKRVGQRSNIHLYEIALSDHNGEITFYQSSGSRNEKDSEKMPNGWDLSGSIRKPKGHIELIPWVTFNQGITVKTKTLDTWCKEQGIDVIDFIWMDVQGAELDVFRGGKNALSKTRFVYTEYSNRELYDGQATLKQLLSHLRNFEVVTRYPADILLRNNQFE